MLTTPAVLPPPRTLAEAGLSLDLVTQLVLKTLYFSGELTGAEIARRLGVTFGIVEPSLDFLKAQYHTEVIGGSMMGGASFRYRITTEGRGVAGLFLQQSQYVGTAPVPLAQYRAYMTEAQRSGGHRTTRNEVREAFSHLVLSDAVLDEIGPAINGGRSLFIYGPPGNGKTVIAHGIRGLLSGHLAIPYALEVEGNIIRVFDPVNHQEIAQPPSADDGLALNLSVDRRWAICRRPLVAVGGELTLESLELAHDERLGYYQAPVQLVANGGLLIVDDFGRQRCAPHDLLNRWMVPLENGLDYLTLKSGLKFEIPFNVFVAFATNVRPSDLVDEAFLRRVQYKVFAESPSRDNYLHIFENYCRDHGLAFDRRLVESLLDGFYAAHHVSPRACHPRDLISQALLLAEYRGEPRALTLSLLETACGGYFVEDRD